MEVLNKKKLIFANKGWFVCFDKLIHLSSDTLPDRKVDKSTGAIFITLATKSVQCIEN